VGRVVRGHSGSHTSAAPPTEMQSSWIHLNARWFVGPPLLVDTAQSVMYLGKGMRRTGPRACPMLLLWSLRPTWWPDCRRPLFETKPKFLPQTRWSRISACTVFGLCSLKPLFHPLSLSFQSPVGWHLSAALTDWSYRLSSVVIASRPPHPPQVPTFVTC
jgi:hypothetical protein